MSCFPTLYKSKVYTRRRLIEEYAELVILCAAKLVKICDFKSILLAQPSPHRYSLSILLPYHRITTS